MAKYYVDYDGSVSTDKKKKKKNNYYVDESGKVTRETEADNDVAPVVTTSTAPATGKKYKTAAEKETEKKKKKEAQLVGYDAKTGEVDWKSVYKEAERLEKIAKDTKASDKRLIKLGSSDNLKWGRAVHGTNEVSNPLLGKMDEDATKLANINLSSYLETFGYSSMDEVRADKKKSEKAEALQKKYAGYTKASDYDKLSVAGESKVNKEAKIWKNRGDDLYDFINDIDGGRDYVKLQSGATGQKEVYGGYTKYTHMTEEEVALYNYIYAKKGKEKADEYLEDIDEYLVARYGEDTYENMSDVRKALYWFPSGIANWGQGAKQFFSDEELPQTYTQIASEKVKAEAFETAPILGTLYTAGETISQQIPNLILTQGASSVATAYGATAGVANAIGHAASFGGMFMSAGGNAYGQALKEGKSEEEARTYGNIVGALEAGLQTAIGGISGLGGISDTQIMTKISLIENAVLRLGAKYAVQYGAELTEEEAQLWLEPLVRTLVFGEEYNAPEIEEMVETAFITAISTVALNAPSNISDGTKVNGLTGSDAKVVNSEVEKIIQEKEKSGVKVTPHEKSKIQEEVIERMEKGDISIDTIVEVLDGKTYEEYKSLAEEEKSLKAEIEELENTPEQQFTIKQRERLTAAREELKNLASKKKGFEPKLNDIEGIARKGMLGESYNESARRKQKFDADLTQYKGKRRAAVERAINSGVLNDTRRAHELVDILSKIEADKGITFDYTNNEKLKESLMALEGKTVNGFVKDGKVTLNVQSSKAWQSTVGHEIGHVLEGTEAYGELQQALFKYAESKGELASRKAALTELYKDMDADIDSELTADLLGDYLFTDKAFVDHLTGNRTLFQKVYDEIKYLCKVATGKELTEIEKVKREFDRAWKEYGKDTVQDAESDVKYSISEDGDYIKAVESGDNETARKMVNQAAKKAGFTSELLYHGTDKFGFTKIDVSKVLGKTAFFATNSFQTGASYANVSAETIANEETRQIGNAAFDAPVAEFESNDDDAYKPKTRSTSTAKDVNTSGVYGLYASEENQLVIEANGEHWTEVPLGKFAKAYTEWATKARGYDISKGLIKSATTKNIAAFAKDNGYRSVRFSNINDLGGYSLEEAGASDVYAFFYPETDIKSADPVTYDDKGNVIPLSERFNTENDDIRYSISEDSEGHKLSDQQMRYFADSVVRDDKGRLLPVYHGTEDAGFTVFSDKKGRGIFFAKSLDTTKSYSQTDTVYAPDENSPEISGAANYKVYLNITNPLVIQGKGAQWNHLEAEDDIVGLDISVKSVKEDGTCNVVVKADIKGKTQKHTFKNAADVNKFFTETFNEDYAYGITQFLDAYAAKAETKQFDLSVELLWDFEKRGYGNRAKSTRDIVREAYGSPNKYDGVVFKNIVDPAHGEKLMADDVYVAFESNQIKSVNNTDPTKSRDIRYSISAETDADYMSAVERGDTEAAQLMVDEAAKNAGYGIKAYHGTGYDFTVFDKARQGDNYEDWGRLGKGFYFAPTSREAETWAELSRGGKNKVMPVYLRSENMLDSFEALPENLKDTIPADWEGLTRRLAEKYAYNYIEYMQEFGYDVQKILTEKGYDGINGHTEFVVFDPEQVKSADAVTYDDKGNVIPLSERFNTANEDIRYSLSEDSEGKQLSKEQSEYFKDSKVVDENGNLKVMYHGTPNGNFTVFKDGTYFTDNKEYADKYQNPGASSISTKKSADAPKTYAVYLDIKKPFDLNDAEAKRIYIEEYIKGGNAVGINPYLSDAEYNKINSIDWTEGEDLRDFLVENDYDYDGLILDEGATGGYGDAVEYRGNSYVVFSPEQVKDIDNKNPTKDPDIRRSLSNEGEEFAPTGNFGTPLNKLALEQDAAPVSTESTTESTTVETAEDIAPVEEVDTPFPDEIAPMTEEAVNENPLPTNATSEEIIKTIKDRLSAKVANSTKQLEDTKLLRDWVRESYAHKIEKLQATYDSKKNKDTKVAVGIQRRISNLQRVAADLDADLAKRISDIESRVSKTSERLQNPQKKDILEVRYERINKHLEADKASLKEAFEARKAELERNLADKSTYFSNKAHVLYNEVNGMKKGVRVTEELGYLLDNLDMSAANKADSYKSLRQALLNIKNRPNNTVNQNSAIESIAREMLAASYENDAYDLADMDNQYQAEVEKLEADAQKQRDAAREEESALRRGDVRNAKIAEIESTLSIKGFNLDSMLDNPVRQLSTLETVDTMPQRVMEKTFGYEAGQALADATVNKVALNESEGIKWIDSITNRKSGLLAQLSKQYNIKPGSKEIQAAQMYAEGSWVNEETDEEFAYGDAELAKDFPDVRTQNNIKALVRDPRIRQFYDETLDKINEARKRNGYPEIPKRNNYYLHYREMGDFFTKNGLPFNPNDMRAKDLTTDLVGRTADLKPGQPYFTSSMQRKGKKTSYNLFEGMERYANSAKNQIYHLDDIQTLRALHYHLAERFGQAQGLENLNSLTPEQASERIKQVYGSHLSSFAAFLDTEANILAGKTSMIDRAFSEGMVGRRILTFMDALNKQTGAAMIGYNVSSANTNWLPVVREFANANPVDSVKALAQTVANIATRGKLDSFREDSSVYIRRQGADRFNRKLWQKMQDPAYALMGAVDSISTEIIARTEYNKAIRNGMSEQEAHFEADKKTSRLMADRSLGQMPQLYTSRIMGLFTKFQLEVRNDLDSMFYDTLQETKLSNKDIENKFAKHSKTAAQVAWRYGVTALALHMFGQAFESIAGYNPAFDLIEAISKTFGWDDDDDDDDEDTWRDNLGEGAMSLLGDLPYASIFLDGGRIPISSALPDFEGIITGKDEYGNEKTLGDAFLEIAPYMLPAGGNQLKKTYQGLKMFSDEHPVAGSYTDSGDLRFPVEDTLGNRIQAGIFGQYASDNAREYFDNGYAPLKEKQIKEYIDVEMPIKDYWEYREGLKEQDTLEDKFDYVAGLDLPVEKKNILINNIVDRKEDVDLENYDDFADYEEFDFATKNPEKWDFMQANNISYNDYTASKESREAYNWAYNNPELYSMSKLVTDDVVAYREYRKALNDIEADKDYKGNSIKGSKEDKVAAYVSDLNVDYYSKLILFKYECKGNDEYNNEIIEYINGREDMSYDEKLAIYKKLGFKVSDGYVYWD